MRQVKSKKKGLSFKIKLMIVLCAVIAGATGIFFMTTPGKYVVRQSEKMVKTIRQKAHLTLERVIIEGHIRTHKEDVMRVLNIAQGMPILEVNLDEVRSRIAELPWIKSVRVERHLPASLYIRVEEKTPIAVWQNKGKYFPLDETGAPINDNKTVLSNLILVVGKDAPAHTTDLINGLSRYPHLAPLVRSAVRVGERRWNLILFDIEKGTVIYLPESQIEGALKRLQSLHKTQQILDKDFKVIDLRLNDRLIVRTTADLDDYEKKDKKK